MLRIENLAKRLGGFAMRDLSFEVNNGDYFVLLGESGVGKTVLLETIAGLVSPDSGRIMWDDDDVTWKAINKRKMGLVPQDQALFPHMTVRGNIGYGMSRRKERNAKVRELADLVGVGDLLDRYPSPLSGGEKQRVALARTLATNPRCLLLDEPMSSLDTRAKSEMRSLLRSLNRKGHTVVHVTHDYEETLSLATHVGIMENGTIVQSGPPTEVFHHPKSEFVARFVGIRNFYRGKLEKPHHGGMSRFVTEGLSFLLLSESGPGPGNVIFRSEDVSVTRTRPPNGLQNSFMGVVVDLAPARLGVEVIVDIGVEIAAMVPVGSADKLEMNCGQKVWVSFRPAVPRFYGG